MTPQEREIAINLDRCTYLPGSFEKRFARDMAFFAQNDPDREMTARQRSWMLTQLKRYRRQIPNTYEKYKHLIPLEK